MKIAISVPDSLSKEVDRLAKICRVPRSRVYVAAVKEHLKALESKLMLEKLNEVHSGEMSSEDKAFTAGSLRALAQILAKEKY
jgi:predicted transcriptional regulator